MQEPAIFQHRNLDRIAMLAKLVLGVIAQEVWSHQQHYEENLIVRLIVINIAK